MLNLQPLPLVKLNHETSARLALVNPAHIVWIECFSSGVSCCTLFLSNGKNLQVAMPANDVERMLRGDNI